MKTITQITTTKITTTKITTAKITITKIATTKITTTTRKPSKLEVAPPPKCRSGLDGWMDGYSLDCYDYNINSKNKCK